jgi:hypothetical protein
MKQKRFAALAFEGKQQQTRRKRFPGREETILFHLPGGWSEGRNLPVVSGKQALGAEMFPKRGVSGKKQLLEVG